MTGKVFEDSTNIYQDQAKVLFEYYKKAAEKIVEEEKQIEQNISDLNKQIDEAEHKIKLFKILMIIFFILGVIGGLIFLILLKKKEKLIVKLKEEISVQEEKFKNIRRDYSIDKIGVVYVPVATRVPFEGKSFLVDHTRKVQETNFQLTVLHKPEEFSEALDKLQSGMETMPIVEANTMPEEVDTSNYSTSVQNITLHDYVGNIDRQVRNISYLLNDSEKVSVSIPVIKPESEEEKYIDSYATIDTGDKPVLNVFDISDFDNKLNSFASLNAMKNQIKNDSESDNSEYMKKLMVQLAETVQLLTLTKSSGSSKLISYTTNIFENVLKSSYNQYSPILEAEEIERIRTANFDYQTSVNDYKPFALKQGSRVKFDLFSGNWVAEDGSRTTMPFGMHQVDEEVLMPVIQNLMEENRIERLKIYNNIEDQKREYLEKWTSETGAYFRDNRKSADDLITHMREAFADYTSSATTYKSLMKTQDMLDSQGVGANVKVEAENAQDEMIAGFETQAMQCNKQQEEFADFMDRIQDDINDSKERFGHVEYYEASLRDNESHNMAVSMNSVQDLEPRKKQLVSVSPYFANNAIVPPLPDTQPELMQDLDINLNQQVSESLFNLSQNEHDESSSFESNSNDDSKNETEDSTDNETYYNQTDSNKETAEQYQTSEEVDSSTTSSSNETNESDLEINNSDSEVD
ncbi:MAG: hypothetical protein HUK25_05705 [Treponema sp.]|nr:hypothetical protein [Treponema sp.]